MTDAAQPTTPASPVVFVVEYSEKAIALVGDTRAMKDQLAALGAKWNGSLKCGKGHLQAVFWGWCWLIPSAMQDG